MDIILIQTLHVETLIGILPAERQFKQKLLIDLAVETQVEKISQTDSLDDAIDYAALSEFIIDFGKKAEFHMIETFAQRLSESIFAHFPLIRYQKMTVYKPGAVLKAHRVSITIERSRA